MRRITNLDFWKLLFLSAIALALPMQTYAVPNTINFQSKLVDKTTGINISNGSPACVTSGADTCDFRFSIYSDSSGGTLYWRETYTDIEVGDNAGKLDLELNSICTDWASPTAPGCSGAGLDWSADSTIYLEMEWDTDGNGDFVSAETFARKQISSTAFANYSADSNRLEGLLASQFLQIENGTQSINSTGSTALISLDEIGTGTPNLFELKVAGTDQFVLTNAGSLGLGVSNPDAWLDIRAATTSSAQINLTDSVGVNPTTPVSGDLWWNGTNLNFFDGTSTVDLLAGGGGSSLFTDGGAVTYLTSATDSVTVGGTAVNSAVFALDVSGVFYLGNNSVDPKIEFRNTNAASAFIEFNANDAINISNGTSNAVLGINIANPSEALDVGGNIQLTGNINPATASTQNIASAANPFLAIYGDTLSGRGIVVRNSGATQDVVSIGDDANGGNLFITDTVATNKVGITATDSFFDGGNFGIGTDTPLVKFDVYGGTASFAASTAAYASVNFKSGVDPTSPNAGDLWWNGTNLNFFDGTSTIDLLAGGGSTTASSFITIKRTANTSNNISGVYYPFATTSVQIYEQDGITHNTSSGQFTFVESGKYYVTYNHIENNYNITGSNQVSFLLNGSSQYSTSYGYTPDSHKDQATFSSIIDASAGDYFELELGPVTGKGTAAGSTLSIF